MKKVHFPNASNKGRKRNLTHTLRTTEKKREKRKKRNKIDAGSRQIKGKKKEDVQKRFGGR